MNKEKVCAALAKTDRLGCGFTNGCAVAQLIMVAANVDQENATNERWEYDRYTDMFDGILGREYDMTSGEVYEMVNVNDRNGGYNEEDEKARHVAVMAHYGCSP